MNSDSHRLHHLFGAHSDGTITPEEHAELQECLRSDASARRLWFAHQDIDDGLHDLAHAPTANPVTKAKPTRWLQWRPLAAAAVFVVMLGVAAMWFMKAPAVMLAKVSGDVRVWRAQETMKGASGFALRAGDWLLTGNDGAAELVFPGETTRLIIGAKAEFGVVASSPGKELKLTAGTMTASVARQSASHPMMIRTPTAKAEVLGTKFELGADKVTTKLNVTEGRVLIARTDDESGVVVEATQSATVTETAPVAVTVAPAAQSLAAGLLAHWKLDGSGEDASGHGHDLTFGAGVAFSDGRFGKALDLHAAKADVESPHIVFPAQFTISMWVRLNQGEARPQPLIGFDGQQAGVDDFWLNLLPNFPGSGIVFDTRGQQMGSRAFSREHVVLVGKWHCVTVIVDSVQGRASFHVDGREVTGQAGLRQGFKLAGPLLIGRRVKGGPLPFDGQFDDIRIYGRALSSAEISTLFDAPSLQ